MSAEIASIPQTPSDVAKPTEKPAWMDDMVKTKDYLCRVSLNGTTSDLVATGKCAPGTHVYVVKADEFIDLGKEFDAFIVDVRPKALDFSGAVPLSYFDRSLPGFAKTIEKAQTGGNDSKCLFGPEYLIWIDRIKKFATYFLSSPTAKQQNNKMHALTGSWATFKSTLIEGKANGKKWWGPVVVPCSLSYDPPPQEQWTKWVTFFKTEPSSQTTTDTTKTREDR